MNKKYHSLNKEQKKEVNKLFQKEYKTTDLNTRLTRLLIYSTIGIIFSSYLLIDYFILDNKNIGNLIIGITLFIASLTFLIGRYFVKLKVLNKLALKIK